MVLRLSLWEMKNHFQDFLSCCFSVLPQLCVPMSWASNQILSMLKTVSWAEVVPERVSFMGSWPLGGRLCFGPGDVPGLGVSVV